MCGLFGVVDQKRPAVDFHERAERALSTLVHRGPDQWSSYVEHNFFMGHRRLSILDLSEHGRQPMTDASQRVSIVANGEIYNFRELRHQLGNSRFVSESDSEVILNGYNEWGIRGLLARLEGMYAFAVHDRPARKLYLVRDRVGIKPLYYATHGSCFVWASELKAIEKFLENESLRLDRSALYDFLTYRYIPSPKSVYEQVFKLPPAHVLTLNLDGGNFSVDRYWHLQVDQNRLTDDEAAEELRSKIGASVAAQLVSDVPIGCFLSGGIDSTIVTAEMSRRHDSLNTFSIGFDEPSYDETKYAAIAASKFETTHRMERLVQRDSQDLLELMKRLYDEPFGDYSALPTWRVSGLARSTVTVALSGDGGDELFGGYHWYNQIAQIMKRRGWARSFIERGARWPYRKRPSHKVHSLLNKVAIQVGSPIFELYVLLMNGVPWKLRRVYRRLLEISEDYDDYWHIRRYYDDRLGPRKSLQYLDFHTYLPDDILTKVDRASMNVSLESRVPFLATDLVEFAFSLDEQFIYRDGSLKGGLKYAYRDLLPPEILNRSKKGFGIPVAHWGVLKGEEAFELRVLRDLLKGRAEFNAVVAIGS